MAPLLFSQINLNINKFRHFVTSTVSYCVPASGSGSGTNGNKDNPIGIRKFASSLNTMQRWALVFSGRYKSKADIPEQVPMEVLIKAQSKARIKLSNILMVLTMIGCLCYAYSGRQAAGRGESVSQMNLDWHKDYNAKAQKEKERNESKA